mmetsp:Transcript_7249/g.10383  ORF Transcript_7249/g.10383 Transcript_7249/m.10383 type:complete len:215 (-) Transcript_7249:1629-2273(-)
MLLVLYTGQEQAIMSTQETRKSLRFQGEAAPVIPEVSGWKPGTKTSSNKPSESNTAATKQIATANPSPVIPTVTNNATTATKITLPYVTKVTDRTTESSRANPSLAVNPSLITNKNQQIDPKFFEALFHNGDDYVNLDEQSQHLPSNISSIVVHENTSITSLQKSDISESTGTPSNLSYSKQSKGPPTEHHDMKKSILQYVNQKIKQVTDSIKS